MIDKSSAKHRQQNLGRYASEQTERVWQILRFYTSKTAISWLIFLGTWDILLVQDDVVLFSIVDDMAL